MGQILVRNLDDEVVRALKAKAARADKSLEQYIREVLADAAGPSKQEVLQRLDAFRANVKLPPDAPRPEDVIRHQREKRAEHLYEVATGSDDVT